jgi:hypothetical protein
MSVWKVFKYLVLLILCKIGLHKFGEQSYMPRQVCSRCGVWKK